MGPLEILFIIITCERRECARERRPVINNNDSNSLIQLVIRLRLFVVVVVVVVVVAFPAKRTHSARTVSVNVR